MLLNLDTTTYSYYIGNSSTNLADYAKDVIENNRYIGICPGEDKWPPNSFNVVVSVAMITYNDRPSERHYIKIAKKGSYAVDKTVKKYFQAPSAKKVRQDKVKVIKDISKIFDIDTEGKKPKCILIEGAPGIGKTILAQNIALSWAKYELLTEIDLLFLLFLRDPDLQRIKTSEELIRYVGMGSFSDEKVADFTRKLEDTKKICFVLDGYDEYPFPQNRTLITDLIHGGIFPTSLVVVTSRPIATLNLHKNILNLKKIEILGLAKEERDEYILQALCGSSAKIEELEKYLKQQPIINGLCYIPLYLAILLYLFKNQCLPKSLTEMNESFILHTVYRHLSKYGQAPSFVVTKIADLPIFKDFMVKIVTLAFNGLKNNQLVFKNTEIDFDIVSEHKTKNGFGLLQAIEHYPKKGVGKAHSFNFLHFTMQEFLAAYHVSMLSNEMQSKCMKETFWKHQYSFMWMMYVGLVGVNSDIFVQFISKGKTYEKSEKGLMITSTIRNDKTKRLHVFQCYMEAKSTIAQLPLAISSMFKDGKVCFNDITLLSYHVSSLTSFMSTASINVPWKTLELKSCKLDDAAMNILELFIVDNHEKIVTLESVNLSENLSSPWSVYCCIIKYCTASSLTLYGDVKHDFKGYIDGLKDSLESNGRLKVITLCGIEGSELPFLKEALSYTTTLNVLNVSLKQANDKILIRSNFNGVNINVRGELDISTLHSINISGQSIDDQSIFYIAFGLSLQKNVVLESLNMSHNGITDLGLLAVADSLEGNNTIHDLDVSNNPFTSQGIIKFLKINQNLGLQKLNVSELSISDKDANSISDFVNSSQTLLCFTMSKLVGFSSEGARIFVDTFEDNKKLQTLDISEINLTDDGAPALSSFIKNDVIREIFLSRNRITEKGAKILAKALKKNTSLTVFDISENWIENKGIVCFLKNISKSEDSNLRKLLVARNLITKSCTRQIQEKLENISAPLMVCSSESDLILNGNKLIIKMTRFTISNLEVHKDGDSELAVKEISDAKYRIKFICSCLRDNCNLTSIKLSKMEITSESAEKLAKVIECNEVLENLNISNNLLGDHGVCIISNSLKHNKTLQTLNISRNDISSDGAKKLAEALVDKENCKLKKLDISENNISGSGIVSILDSNSTLEELDVSNNNIEEDTLQFKEISRAIEKNTNLKCLKLMQSSIKNKPTFHSHILHAFNCNNTVTKLTLSFILDDTNNKMLQDKVKKINKERKFHGIKILQCTM